MPEHQVRGQLASPMSRVASGARPMVTASAPPPSMPAPPMSAW